MYGVRSTLYCMWAWRQLTLSGLPRLEDLDLDESSEPTLSSAIPLYY